RSTDLSGPAGPKTLALGIAAGAIAAGLALMYLVPKLSLLDHRPAWTGLGLVAALVVVLVVFVADDPLSGGWTVGSVGLLLLGLTALLILLAVLEQIFWRPPSGFFAVLHLRRAPIVSVVVVTVLLTGQFDKEVGFHAIRQQGATVTGDELLARRRVNLDDAVTSFVNGLDDEVTEPAAGQETTVPMFLIATSGGGARAAYWTLLTTNCLFGAAAPAGVRSDLEACQREPAAWDDVFMASGISGGSLGLAMYSAAQQRGDPTVPLDDVFADGFLDPVVASMLFVDVPNSVVKNDTWTDRAAWLELAWEEKEKGLRDGLFETQLGTENAPQLPVLLLNSAAVEDGCRLNVSVVDLVDERSAAARSTCRAVGRFEQPQPEESEDPRKPRPASATRDVDDYVCSDINLSTAALLSARFPFVSPTGGLTACEGSNVPPGDHTFGVDGGYVDSSAASPLVEILDASVDEAETQLAPDPGEPDVCVQPVVLQIDNGYSDLTKPKGTDRPRELLAPLAGYGAASGGRADAARQALAIEASRPRCAGAQGRATYFHVFPRARPGIEAPLGWSLSKAARNDLRSQLANPANAAALCNAKRWLVPATPECPVVVEALDPFADEAQLPGSGGVLLLIAVVVLGLAGWLTQAPRPRRWARRILGDKLGGAV
ncbi:MAG: hypothetical protein ACRDY6_01440, partial [Acidimicrobiia bacterium]